MGSNSTSLKYPSIEDSESLFSEDDTETGENPEPSIIPVEPERRPDKTKADELETRSDQKPIIGSENILKAVVGTGISLQNSKVKGNVTMKIYKNCSFNKQRTSNAEPSDETLNENCSHPAQCIKMSNYLQTVVRSLQKTHRIEGEWIFPLLNSFKVSCKKLFVDLDLEVLDKDQDEIISTNEPISCSSLLKLLFSDKEAKPNQILILGDIGSGKTFLCQKICNDWGCKEQNISKPWENVLPILVSLKDLPPNSSLENELYNHIHNNSGRNSDITQVEKELYNYKGHLAILLDGYDEISEDNEKQVQNLLTNQQSPFRGATFIVTSRLGTGIEGELLFDKRYLIQGLSEENSTDLIRKFFLRDPQYGEKVRNHADELSFLTCEDSTPLVITFLCHVCKRRKTDEFMTLEKILHRIHYLLAIRCNRRNKDLLNSEKIWLTLNRLGRFFYKQETRTATKSGNRNDDIIQTDTLQHSLREDFHFLTNCGILKKIWNEPGFVALHRIFAEYLVLRYLTSKLSNFSSDDQRIEFLKKNGLSDQTRLDIFVVNYPDVRDSIMFVFTFFKDFVFRLNWDSKNSNSPTVSMFKIDVNRANYVNYVGFPNSSDKNGRLVSFLEKVFPRFKECPELNSLVNHLPNSECWIHYSYLPQDFAPNQFNSQETICSIPCDFQTEPVFLTLLRYILSSTHNEAISEKQLNSSLLFNRTAPYLFLKNYLTFLLENPLTKSPVDVLFKINILTNLGKESFCSTENAMNCKVIIIQGDVECVDFNISSTITCVTCEE